MIIGIHVDLPVADRRIEFSYSEQILGFKQVRCNATIEELRSYRGQIEGLIIPKALPSVDYDFRHFIEHVRIDSDKEVAQVPIIVFAGTEDEYLELFEVKSEFREELYKGIAVVVSDSPSREGFVRVIDPVAMEVYQKQAAIAPHYSKGRHDQANAWGAYTAAESLHATDPSPETNSVVANLRATLAEDSFYKRRMQGGFAGSADNRLGVELRHLQSKVTKRLGGNGSILIVEDQLDDGWEEVYRLLFSHSDSDVAIDFATTEAEAREKFTSKYQLVLLDIRLGPDREAQCQEESEQRIEDLGGVRLAKVFRNTCSTVPIIAATASNKSWTLEALLDRGIDAYWVKAAPETVMSIDQGLLNLIDFYKKLDRTLEWAHRTRPWLENFYATAEIVATYDFANGSRLKEKGKSLHALLSRAFSPFSSDLSKGLQMNLAYLIVWSAMNDVVTSILKVEEDENSGGAKWYMESADGRKSFVTKKLVSDGGGGKIPLYFSSDGVDQIKTRSFPDTLVGRELLSYLRLHIESDRFWRHHRNIRNGLPLIHGKTESAGAPSKSVGQVADEDIGELINILNKLAGARADDLAAMRPSS